MTMQKETIYQLIKHYEQVSFTLYKCHKLHATKTMYLANTYNILTIIITSFTGTSSISLLFDKYQSLQILNIIFSYIIVLLGMAQRVYEPSKKYEQHKRALRTYLQLHYKIKEYMTFNEIDISEEMILWTRNINTELEEYRNSFPHIEDNIYDKIKYEYITVKDNNEQV